MKKASKKLLTELALSKRDIAVLAVFFSGGDKRLVDTEDIAVKAAELAPKAFAWRKYPEQINLELVRAVLSDAKKPQFGSLLHGTGTTGWRLSNAGVAWAHSKASAFAANRGAGNAVAKWAGSSDARRSDREKQRLRTSAAWLQWESTGAVDRRAARQLFRIDDYATAEMADIKVARLRGVLSGDEEAIEFLKAAATALLEEEKGENTP